MGDSEFEEYLKKQGMLVANGFVQPGKERVEVDQRRFELNEERV